MPRGRTQRLSWFACSALIALALVPLLVCGHVHREADAVTSPCAACFVAHHAAVKPVTPAALPGVLAPSQPAASEIALARVAEPRSTNGVRAPPHASQDLV